MSKMTDKLGGAMRASLGWGTQAAAEAQAPPPMSMGGNLYAGTRGHAEARASRWNGSWATRSSPDASSSPRRWPSSASR